MELDFKSSEHCEVYGVARFIAALDCKSSIT